MEMVRVLEMLPGRFYSCEGSTTVSVLPPHGYFCYLHLCLRSQTVLFAPPPSWCGGPNGQFVWSSTSSLPSKDLGGTEMGHVCRELCRNVEVLSGTEEVWLRCGWLALGRDGPLCVGRGTAPLEQSVSALEGWVTSGSWKAGRGMSWELVWHRSGKGFLAMCIPFHPAGYQQSKPISWARHLQPTTGKQFAPWKPICLS